MARVTVEDCLRQVDSRFALVHLAVRRVLQIRKGSAPLIEAPKNKEVVVALREIAAGMVTLDNLRELEVGPDYYEADLVPEAAAGEEAKGDEKASQEQAEPVAAEAEVEGEQGAAGEAEADAESGAAAQQADDEPAAAEEQEEPEEGAEKAS